MRVAVVGHVEWIEFARVEHVPAPTNGLVVGGSDLPLLAPGDSYRATFSIAVTHVAQ